MATFRFGLAMSCALLVAPPDRGKVPAAEQPAANSRRPASDADLRRWLENMLVDHRFTADEASAATGLSADEITAAAKRFGLDQPAPRVRQPGEPLRVLPYPGGRHPRLGFLDGAVRPQRETKFSVFAPWESGGYAVVDVPEAIWHDGAGGQPELLYLAHTHVPTLWSKQGIDLERLEWKTGEGNALEIERTLPNGVAFGAKVMPEPSSMRMELWLTNGSGQPLSGLRVQNCVMLGHLTGFAAQTNDNKVFRSPYVACRNEAGDRWIITQREHPLS
ncbi:MAG: hypothetical protein U0836_05360 [Pirellulales bacterium]